MTEGKVLTAEPEPYNPKAPKDLAEYDKITQIIWRLLAFMPISGKPMLANIYMTSPMMYNYMMVGATGMVISWFLYEILIRPLLIPIGGIGTFLGMAITTLCVFMYNFALNKKWSLNPKSQILKMDETELKEVRDFVTERLFEIASKENIQEG